MSILVAKGDYWVGKGLARKRLAEDLAGGDHGALIGGARYVADSPQSAHGSLLFDGQSYVQMQGGVDYAASGTIFVEIEVFLTDTSNVQGIVMRNGGTGVNQWLLRIRLGLLRFQIYFVGGSSYELSVDAAILGNTWAHIGALYDQGTARLLVDGEEVDSAAGLPDIAVSTDPVTIGATGTGGWLIRNGSMVRELRIWEEAPSDSQIRQNMHRRLVGNEPGLLGYWPLADRCPVLISSHPYRDAELGQAQPRIPAGSDPEFRSAIAWPQHRQRAQLSYGALRAIAVDGQLDHFQGGTFRGRPFELRTAERPDQPWEETQLHYKCYVEHVRWIGERFVEFEFRNPAKLLQNPIQINTFDDTTPNEALRGQRKPMLVGICEHIPGLLFDAIGTDEEQWYVADNYNGSWAGASGTLHAVNEGLAEIAEGGSAGQFEYLLEERSVLLHKHPTLPVTIGWARGPRKRLMRPEIAHFGDWSEPDDVHPQGWTIVNESDSGSAQRWVRRFEDSDSMQVYQSSISSYVEMVADVNFPTDDDVIVRIRAGSVDGWSNRARALIYGHFSQSGVVSLGDVSIEGPGVFDVPAPNSSGEYLTALELRWYQHPDDYFGSGDPSRLRLYSVQVLHDGTADDPLNVPHIARTAYQIVPYLLLERGVEVEPGLELGPLKASEIDFDSFPDYGVIGRWWDDDTTHEQMLDRICHNYNGGWVFTREGKIKFVEMALPNQSPGTPIDVSDYNRGREMQIDTDPAERLTTRIGIRQNFAPLAEGEVALSVSTQMRKRYGREWVQTLSAPPAAIENLHPDYDQARSADPRETMIVSATGADAIVTDVIEAYAQRRYLTRIERITADFQPLEPGDLLNLSTHRFQVDADGRLLTAMDVRNLPVSGRSQIIAWS